MSRLHRARRRARYASYLGGVVTPPLQPTIALVITPAAQPEGSTGTTAYAWTATLVRNGSTATIPYVWSVAGNGANPADAADFGGAFPGGSNSFAPGETIKTGTILVTGDQTVELDESFLMTFVATGVGTATATGSILNDDVPGTYLPTALGTPMFAVGTRKLIASATEAMQVRPTTTGADTAIGFTGQNVNTTALAAVAAKVLVQRWTDQSGNGRHMDTEAGGARPRIEAARTDYVTPPVAFGYDDDVTGLPMGLAVTGLTGDRRNASIYIVSNPRRSNNGNVFWEARSGTDTASLVFVEANQLLRETNTAFNTVTSGKRPRAQLATVGMTYSGTQRAFYMREARVTQAVAPVGAFDAVGIGRSTLLTNLNQTIGDYLAVVAYPVAHTQAEAQSVIDALNAIFSVPTVFTSRAILMGDSLFDNFYAARGVGDQLAQPGAEVFTLGRPSQTAATIYADRVASIGDLTDAPYGAGKTTLVWEAGGNDIANSGSTDADVLAITNNARTWAEGLGFRFVPTTLAWRGDAGSGAKGTYRLNYNTSIMAGTYTAKADIASATGFQATGENYIGDGIHWTRIGMGRAAAVVKATLA